MRGIVSSEIRRLGDTPCANRSGFAAVVVAALAAALLALPVGAADAVASAGSVYAFGSNYSGQLGNANNNGTSNANPTPALVTLPGQSGPVTEVATGADHSLVLTSGGQLYAFGANRYGELGNATNNGTTNANPTPTLVTLPGQVGTVTQIAAGFDFSLAATSGGQLYAFGYNYFGQLGNATNNGTTNANPTPTLVTLPGQVGAVSQIAAGTEHSLVVTSSGQLYAFGNNGWGQLGSTTNNGTSKANPTPTQVTLPGQSGGVIQAAAGDIHSLAVTSSGKLYAFGYNHYGELGNANNTGTGNPNPTPTLVTLTGQVGGVTQAAAGEGHSLALTSSGQVYGFGYNYFGQLGNANNNGTSTANPTPTLVALSGQRGAVSQIAAGEYRGLVVTTSGQLYAFGYNSTGELGNANNNGTVNPNPTPTVVALPQGTTIDSAGTGSEADHTLALVSDLAITSGSLPAGKRGSSYSTAVSAAGGTAPRTWSASGLPPGLSLNPASGVISGTPTSARSFLVTATVTDRYGSQAAKTFTLLVGPPAVSGAHQSHKIWRAGKHLAKATKKHKHPLGTTFTFTLNEPARVSFAFTQQVPGRKGKHGKCVAQTKQNSSKHACKRTVTRGTLSFAGHAGTNKLSFQGRLPSKKLKLGRYTLIITATNAAGQRSKPRKLSFTIVKQ